MENVDVGFDGAEEVVIDEQHSVNDNFSHVLFYRCSSDDLDLDIRNGAIDERYYAACDKVLNGQDTIIVVVDGSSAKKHIGGYGVVIFMKKTFGYCGNYYLNTSIEAEMKAILEGLKESLKICKSDALIKNINLFTDSVSSIHYIERFVSNETKVKKLFLELYLQNILDVLLQLRELSVNVSISWIVRDGIKLQKIADKLSKVGCMLLEGQVSDKVEYEFSKTMEEIRSEKMRGHRSKKNRQRVRRVERARRALEVENLG